MFGWIHVYSVAILAKNEQNGLWVAIQRDNTYWLLQKMRGAAITTGLLLSASPRIILELPIYPW